MLQKRLPPLLSVLVGLGFNLLCFAEDKPFQDFIEFKAVKHYQVARNPHVYGLFLAKNKLITFLDQADFYYETVYRQDAIDPSMAFTERSFGLADSQEVPFGTLIGRGRYIAMAPLGTKGRLMLDARMQIAAFDEKGQGVVVRSIIVDTLRPPADSRGEPNQVEIGAYRGRLKAVYKEIPPEEMIATGMILRPEELPDSDKAQYLVVTRIPGYQLMTMKCQEDDLGHCEMQRSCFLAGKEPLKAADVTGIAYSTKRHLLFIGDRALNRLYAYRYQSCHHVAYVGVLHLPDKLQNLSGFAIDAEDNLWVATEGKDSYLDASVYIWRPSTW